MEATERFAEVMARDQIAVDVASLLVGAHASPERAHDHEAVVRDGLGALEEFAASVADSDLDPLTAAVFGTHRFVGDRATYYDPRNSYLSDVFERRRGIPISLSIVLMEVGRRVGVELVGVSTPAHFITRLANGDRFVDAFGGGTVLDLAGVRLLFADVAPGVDIEPFLQPVPPGEIIRRLLGNLVGVHRQRGDRDALLWTTRLRTLIPGRSADDRRAYGGALAACGDFAMAAKVIESLVADGEATRPEDELASARHLRARLN